MATFRVTWEIDLDDDTPEGAALQAEEIISNPTEYRPCFKVREHGNTWIKMIDCEKLPLD